MLERHAAALGVKAQPETRLQQEQRRRRRPGLRRAGHWIEGWALAALAGEAAEQPWQAPQVDVDRRVEQALEYPGRLAREAVAREPRGDHRVVVWPERAVVVAHRVVAQLGRGNRPDAPAGKRGAAHQAPDDRFRPMRQRDAGEQGVPGVRCADPAGPLVAIQRQDVGTEVVVPERRVEAETQLLGLTIQGRRALLEPEPSGNGSRPASGSVGIALDLDERDRPLGQGAVGVEDRIVAVLPALIDQPLTCPPAILDEAVAVTVAVLVDPSERRLDIGPEVP